MLLVFFGLIALYITNSNNDLFVDGNDGVDCQGKSNISESSTTTPYPSRHLIANSRTLVATSLSHDSSLFATGAIKLMASIKQQTGGPPLATDYAIILPADRPIPEPRTLRELRAVGWSLLSLARFPAAPRPHAGDDDRTFAGTGFMKLHLWNLTAYGRVVYLESDCLVVGSLAGLLGLDLAARPLWLAVTRGPWAGASDTGVVVLRPDAAEFARLRALALQPAAAEASEEGFLRRAFGRRWGDVGFANGADIAACSGDPGLWRRHAAAGLQVIRYTVLKPWACGPGGGGAFDGVCRLWREVPVTVPCETTLVTAYFRIPSKHSHEEYSAWMRAVLSLDACLVVVADPADRGLLRGRDPRYTRLVAVPLEEAARRLNRTAEFWAGQAAMDPEGGTHKGYRLYWVWALKPVFLRDAVLRDAFGSRYFFWVDIGCLRSSRYLGRTLQSPPPQVRLGPPSVYFSAVNNFTQRDLRLNPDGTAATAYFQSRLAGAIWGGAGAAALAFHDAYFRAFNRQADAGVFVGKDQNVIIG